MPVETALAVGVVGSPASCAELTINLALTAYNIPLLGRTVAVQVRYDGAPPEVALGTVTTVTTVNDAHRPGNVLGRHIAAKGSIGESGDQGDIRSITVKVDAVFRDDPTRGWVGAGVVLSNSPATGTRVVLLDQGFADELTANAQNPAYIGTLRGSDVLIPWTLSDYEPSIGGQHLAALGQSGSGKSGCATLALAAQLRFPLMGQIIVDPQGQWASGQGMVLPLQQLAAATGRQVVVARLSSSLRMPTDVDMFVDLLKVTRFFPEIGIKPGSVDQIEAAVETITNLLRRRDALEALAITDNWVDAEPAPLLLAILETLWKAAADGDIYATPTNAERVMRKIRKPSLAEAYTRDRDETWLDGQPDGIIDQQTSNGPAWRRVFTRFAAVHNLWSRWTPTGLALLQTGTPADQLGREHRRASAAGLLGAVLRPAADRPAPWLILDLSADITGVNLEDDIGDDEITADLGDTRRLLDSPPIKARIIRRLLEQIHRIGQAEFVTGHVLNTQVVIDESWEFLITPDRGTPDAVRDLSNLLADLVRVIRKLGVGFFFILQSPSNVRDDVWRQISALLVGYGLHEAEDARRLATRASSAHMDLYRSVPPPDATRPRRYTFMVTGGGVTGLSLGTAPVFLEMFTTPAQWLHANESWITNLRRRFPQHLPPGDPGGPLRHIPGAAVSGFDGETTRHLAAMAVTGRHANTAAVRAVSSAANISLPPPLPRPSLRTATTTTSR